MKKSDLERIRKIIFFWTSLEEQTRLRQVTREMLLHDEFIQWAFTTPIYNIGEQVYNLSPELKKAHPELPWSAVAGLRHRLVHDYEGINWNFIAEVVFEDMKPFVESLIVLEKELRDAEQS